MHRRRWPFLRLSAAFAALLASVSILAVTSEPPVVGVPEVSLLDDGEEVTVVGLLADLWIWDDGTESMVLADPETAEVLRVACRNGIGEMPSSYATLGDELMVSGVVARRGGDLTLESQSQSVCLLRESWYVLDLGTLSRTWALFEGDEIELRGILCHDKSGSGLAITDSSMELHIEYEGTTPTSLLGRPVIVEGTLLFDNSQFRLLLEATGLRPTA